MTTRTTRTPLTDRPLRNPGDSVQEALIARALLHVLVPAAAAGFFVAQALTEWGRWYFSTPPKPVIMSVLALAAALIASIYQRRAMKRLELLRLGRDGERAVGQFLDKLRDRGAEVFHDVRGDHFNIDHVVIAPEGIFTIETKTWSKPLRGNPEIGFDGARLLKDGRPVERDPIPQALGQAAWLRKFLRESTGREYDARPVVVFPGWMVSREGFRAAREKGVWILNPRAFPGFLEKLQPELSTEELRMASYHLSRYIRTRGATANISSQENVETV